jgi:hypothetical protein
MTIQSNSLGETEWLAGSSKHVRYNFVGYSDPVLAL